MAALAPTTTSSSSLLTSIISITVTVTASVSSSSSPVPSPSTNSAIPSTGTPEKCQSCDEFTRANLVGVFITLILCLLTQPSGSLYFRGHGGFFWRINPVASFVEAGIIFWYLAVAVWEKVAKNRAELRRFRTRRTEIALVLAHAQRMAGALLLIRGQVDGAEKQRREEGDGNAPLLETPLGEGNDEVGDDQHGTVASVGAGGERQSGSDEGRRNDSEDGIELQETTTTGANPHLQEPPLEPSDNDGALPTGPEPVIITPSTQHPTVEPQHSHSIVGPPSSSAPSFSLIQRPSTTELEANPVATSDNDSVRGDTDSTSSHGDPSREVSAAQRRLLQSVFGSDTLTAHRESRIASVTFFSVFVIYVKIFSISGAAWFKTAVWFSLSGWVAVQTLLILHARRRKLSEQDLSEVTRLIRMVDRELDFNTKRPDRGSGRSWWWITMFLVLHFPFWAYVSYRVTFGWKQTSFFAGKDHHEEESVLNWAGSTYTGIKYAIGFWAALCLIFWLIMQLMRFIRSAFRADWDELSQASIHLILCTVGAPLFGAVWMFGALDITTDEVKGWWGQPDHAGDGNADKPSTDGDSSGGGGIPLKIAWYVGYGSWNTVWAVFDILALGLFFFFFAGVSVHRRLEKQTNSVGTRGVHVNNVAKVGPHDRLRVAFFNVLFTLGIFLWYVYTYESEGTSKWWLGEYLG